MRAALWIVLMSMRAALLVNYTLLGLLLRDLNS